MSGCDPGSSHQSITVRLASSPADLIAVQQLRWQVFRSAEQAGGECEAGPALDSDAYDEICDHLMVVAQAIDGGGRHLGEEVIGTYRLLRGSVAQREYGFYSAHEFDVTRLLQYAENLEGEPLEIGRSCVRSDHRTGAAIQALWRGIGQYIQRHDINLMFGCASFPGTDPAAFRAALSLLHNQYLVPQDRRPQALLAAQLELLPEGSYDHKAAARLLPPLIKGYLRAGARFGEGVYIDEVFNTVDVCAVVEVNQISGRYLSRFGA